MWRDYTSPLFLTQIGVVFVFYLNVIKMTGPERSIYLAVPFILTLSIFITIRLNRPGESHTDIALSIINTLYDVLVGCYKKITCSYFRIWLAYVLLAICLAGYYGPEKERV